MSNRYEDVCPSDTGTGNIFSNYERELYCNGDDITAWKNKSKQFDSKYKKANECAVRRIKRMKLYEAITPQERNIRKKHIFPIQVAYTFAKDCLKKSALNNAKINNFTTRSRKTST